MFRSFSDSDMYAWTGHGNGTTAYVSNGLNQQTSIGGAAATWDTKGNLTTEPQSAKTYGYSSENLLTSASGGVTLAYDPALRLYQTVSGATTTRFLYDGLDAIAEYNATNALQRRFVFDPTTGQPVLWYEGTGTAATNRRYLSQDERGSVISVSGSTGASLGINTYDEYGKPGSANLGRYQYTGQKWIGEANVYDYHFRDYLPHLGIFAQTDPIGQAGGPNIYAYVFDDPVNWVDPLGLCNGQLNSAGAVEICGGGTPGAIGPGPAVVVNWVDPPAPREPKDQDDSPVCKQNSVSNALLYALNVVGTAADAATIAAEYGAVETGELTPPALFFHTVAGVSNIVSKASSVGSAAIHASQGDWKAFGFDLVGAITAHGVGKAVENSFAKGAKHVDAIKDSSKLATEKAVKSGDKCK